MHKTLLAIGAASLAVATAVPAAADPPPWAPAHGKRAKDARSAFAPRYYQSDNGVRYWQGDDGQYYCRRSNGTTGMIVGGAAGALAGRAIDTQGNRATGTILGAAAGALLGREIDRGEVRCR
jgi:hypothetical protein